MSRVRLRQRVMDQIRTQVQRANGEAVGGLLIGGPESGGFWIERVLACRNTARDRAGSYRVDPAVLANVGRTLEATGHSVLGVFFGGAGARNAEQVADGRLVWRVDPDQYEEKIVGGGFTKLAVEVLADLPIRALICPE